MARNAATSLADSVFASAPEELAARTANSTHDLRMSNPPVPFGSIDRRAVVNYAMPDDAGSGGGRRCFLQGFTAFDASRDDERVQNAPRVSTNARFPTRNIGFADRGRVGSAPDREADRRR